MRDILERIADSSSDEEPCELICRLRDCAREIEALRAKQAPAVEAAAGEPVSAIVEHDGRGPGPRKVAVLIEQYDPRKPEFWRDGVVAEGYSFTLCYAAPQPASEQQAARVLEWAVSRWNAEVKHRPLHNVYRRTLDDTWRQVIRHCGGDPDTLIGPSHDALFAAKVDGHAD